MVGASVVVAAPPPGVVLQAEQEVPRRRKMSWGRTEVPGQIRGAGRDFTTHHRAPLILLSRGLLLGYIIIHRLLGILGRIITARYNLEVREAANSTSVFVT